MGRLEPIRGATYVILRDKVMEKIREEAEAKKTHEERERDRARAERETSRERRMKEVERRAGRGHTNRDRPGRSSGEEGWEKHADTDRQTDRE